MTERPSILDEEAARRLRHDISSPLMIIGGFAQLLAADKPISDQDRREYASRIDAAAREVRQMIDEVLR